MSSISENSIRTSQEELEKLLKEANLFESLNYTRPIVLDSSKYKNCDRYRKASKKGNYIEIYNMAMEDRAYDILLTDKSIFQISIEKKNKNLIKLRYAYYKSPYQFGDSYEEVIATREDYTSIRYDYDETEYQEGIHPTSHIHIGNDNNIRIPTNKILKPFEFGLFIIKNIYVEEWKNLYHDSILSEKYCFKMKEKLEKIKAEYFSEIEQEKLFFLG